MLNCALYPDLEVQRDFVLLLPALQIHLISEGDLRPLMFLARFSDVAIQRYAAL